MEILFALLAIASAIAYGVLIGINIQRGKPWAREIARVMASLEPRRIEHHASASASRPGDEEDQDSRPDRLVA